MAELYEETQKKLEYLRGKGFNVVTIWECSFNTTLRREPQVQAYEQQLKYKLNELKYHPPLTPRSAYRGGRVNAFKLYHKCNEDEEMDLIDYNSLYPYVLKYRR